MLIYAIAFIVIEFYMKKSKRLKSFYYLCTIYFSVLSLVYFLTICFLNSKMMQLSGDFTSEIRSINWQFAVFLFAYLTRVCFYILQFISGDKIDGFKGAVFLSLANLPWNIIPIFYSLYSHHKVF